VNLGLSGDVRVDLRVVVLIGDGEEVVTFLRKIRAGGNWLIGGIVEESVSSLVVGYELLMKLSDECLSRCVGGLL
jgi:hypothetical protein